MLSVETHPGVQDIDGYNQSKDVDTFERVDVLAPLGCYTVELHPSFVLFESGRGLQFSFRIEYGNIASIHVLSEEASAPLHERQEFVVLSLYSPFTKGRALFSHIVFKKVCFALGPLSLNENHLAGDVKSLLMVKMYSLLAFARQYFSAADKALDSKNELLTRSLILRSGVSIGSPGIFRSHKKNYAVKARVKAYHGFLYPLDDSLLFIPYPSRRIMYCEIGSVEFVWPPSVVVRHYFNLIVRMTTKEKVFYRRIWSEEAVKLSNFLRSRGLEVLNIYLDRVEKFSSYVCTDSEEGERVYNYVLLDDGDHKAADSDDEDLESECLKLENMETVV